MSAKHKNALAVVILAAGMGTRMKSPLPKVMHTLAGLPMINWLLQTVEQLNPEKIVVVTGPDMPDLEAAVVPHEFVTQKERLGTGHAVQTALPKLDGFTGDVLILLGDAPLISLNTLQNLIAARDGAGLSVLGVELDHPDGYGRLISSDGKVLERIVEHKDANEAQRAVKIINSGAFCVDNIWLNKFCKKLTNGNAQGEYYITDLPEIAAQGGVKTHICISPDAGEVQGCNTRVDLAAMEARAQGILRRRAMMNGVSLIDPSAVYFSHDTQIGAGTSIEPNVFFGPEVKIGENVTIKAFCHFEGASVANNVTIGPFARLRPGADLADDVRIGNFVEVKKSIIGQGSKINHLAYVGDCKMGKGVNFSAGAITVNYDGYDKHKTVIGDNVMIGSDVSLIAPITIGDGAFVAAGSSISKDVPADALSISRGKQKSFEGWAADYRSKKEK